MANPRDPDGSTRITPAASTTDPHDTLDTTRTTTTRTVPAPAPAPARPTGTDSRPAPTGAIKTSAAAVFALVFGLAALFCALTAILSPVAVVFGILGIILGIVGLKMTKRPGITGHGVAVGGLVTAILGLLLGGAVLGGLAALVNSDSQLDRITNQIDKLKDDVPSGNEIQDKVTNS